MKFKEYSPQEKRRREKNLKEFQKEVLPMLQDIYKVKEYQYQMYKIITKYCVYDYYPRADKLHNCNEKKWINNGIDYIFTNLLK